MVLDPDAYAQLSPEEQQAHDVETAAREQQEQSSLPYKWVQALDHVEILVPVPSGTRAKQVRVNWKRAYLYLPEGTLAKPIKLDESTWSIGRHAADTDDGTVLNVYLAKENTNEWWPHVFTHHPTIDTTKLAPEDSNLSDLDGETRYAVLLTQQMGLPTSQAPPGV